MERLVCEGVCEFCPGLAALNEQSRQIDANNDLSESQRAMELNDVRQTAVSYGQAVVEQGCSKVPESLPSDLRATVAGKNKLLQLGLMSQCPNTKRAFAITFKERAGQDMPALMSAAFFISKAVYKVRSLAKR